LNNFAREGEKIIAQPIEGEWYTTGDPLNYLKTSYRFAMERDDIKNELKKYLREFL
jgi:UTP--glucose-1-phosphate uridylyltransferase